MTKSEARLDDGSCRCGTGWRLLFDIVKSVGASGGEVR
jgi:hypothetical protein